MLGAVGNLLFAAHVPLMAKFTAGKIMDMLQRAGPILTDPAAGSAHSHPLVELSRRELEAVSAVAPGCRALVSPLLEMFHQLEWFAGDEGPYCSINFRQHHIHALLVGPGGLEHRTDLRIGLTVLSPYTRFPDHRQFHSRVFLPLSLGEFLFGDGHWAAADPGDVLFNGAGQQCAMRCTATPMVVLWCHVEHPAS
ncbi:dimethylsulfonioproprionate lyase family protein [Rhizobium sp. 2YAF20]|uniref:dimethylsulfonioproprionate lyase family protein n=1 Tax=Rhizobium sp. 2YAF20 TaxID=3233027 RepID=UPI003F9E143A